MRLPVLFIMFTVMIDAMGIGLIMPVMPDVMVEVGGGTLGQPPCGVGCYPRHLRRCSSCLDLL